MIAFRQVRLHCNILDGDLLPRKHFHRALFVVVSSGVRIDWIAYMCKNFKEKKQDVASRENQKICGGVLEDLVKKARYTANAGKTSGMTFRGVYDDE